MSNPDEVIAPIKAPIASAPLTHIQRHAATFALCLIVLLGAILRLNGRDWDDSHYLNPDERFMTMVATGISWPSSIAEYFDSAVSPLNPYNNNFPTYVYGTLPLFLGKLAGDLSDNNVYGNFHLAGRSLSTIFDLTTVVLVYFVGRRLFGVRTGLLASLLMSLTALNIQASHFFTADAYLATFILATFLMILKANERGRWWEYLAAGTFAGLAIATKLSGLPAVAMLLLPAVETIRRFGWRSLLHAPRARSLSPLLGVVLALLGFIWAFRIAQPYAFAGPGLFNFHFDPRWSSDIEYWRRVQSGEIDMPPSHQWASRAPLVFLLKNLVLWGMGIPLGITALLGLALGGVRIATARRWPPTWQVILVGWPAFHILYYGTAFIKTMRYVLPAYPFLVLLAAALLVHFWESGSARVPSRIRLRALPAMIVVLATAAYAIAFSGIYSQDTTRIAASRWVYDNVPLGSVVLTEHWDDGIPLLFPDEPTGAYQGTELQLYADDNLGKLIGEDKENGQPGIINQLNEAEYIFVTSNRLYLSIPRIPERFPVSTEYYRMLFSGELGFELVETFTSRPTLFGFELNDDGAEEAFTVYDHPKVLIFKKTPAYDGAKVEAHLIETLNNAGPILNLRPIETGKNFLMFDEAERLVQQAGGTWSSMFDRDDMANRHPIRFWYLALQLMALAAMPLCWRAFRGLPDRGYAISKTIGLLTAGYIAWLLPSLKIVSFGRSVVLIGIGLTAVASAIVVLPRYREFVSDLRSRWREILFVELLFLGSFFLFVYFRSVNPDLWHPYRGGEKPMEFAYFNAVIRSTHFPAIDPWFAGGYINYYYYGYVLLASVARLTGVIPSVAFNLAVPTLFAMLVLNTWGFVRNILSMLKFNSRARWSLLLAALTGPLFVVGLGNLDLARRLGRGQYEFADVFQGDDSTGLGTLVDIVRGVYRSITDFHVTNGDAYWAPTRVIPDTVNEFPYFTFLFSDFHPHMVGLTATSAVLVVALAILQSRRWPIDRSVAPIESTSEFFPNQSNLSHFVYSMRQRVSIDRVLMVVLTAFMTGTLYPLNTWDFPTYLLLVVGAFALLELLGTVGESESLTWSLSFDSLRRVAILSLSTVVLGRIFFIPYFAHYQQPNSGFDAWTQSSTTTDEFLLIHGVMLFFVVTYLLAELSTMASNVNVTIPSVLGSRWVSLPSQPETRTLAITFGQTAYTMNPMIILASFVGVLAFMAIWRDHLLWLLGALVILVAAVAWKRRTEPIHLFLCAMAGLAIAISGAVEKYALRGDIGRFNTVFKFYLQIWVLLALVAAVGSVLLVVRHRSLLTPAARRAWSVVAIVLILAGFVYPLIATPARLDDRFNELPRTLDGTTYMTQASYDDAIPGSGEIVAYPLEHDLVAINWLLDNVKGSPVILEGITGLYRWGSRVSVYTGLPTVLGWDWHQTQQRAGYGELINQRRDQVNFMFNEDVNFVDIQPMLDTFHVRYIYVGDLERLYYSEAGLRKFDNAVDDGLVTIAFQTDAVTIYEYSPPNVASAGAAS